MIQPEEQFMKAAIEEAIHTRELGDYAVGSVVVKDGKIVAHAGNRTHIQQDPTLHAEVIAIKDAARKLGRKDLSDCVLYSTHEPCPMCAGAAIWARIPQVIWGASIQDTAEYANNKGTEDFKWRVVNIPAKQIFENGNPKVEYFEGFMRDECIKLYHS